MSIISRFFGRKEPAAGQPNAEPAALVSNPDQKDGMSLQVAFAGPLPNQADALTRALQAYHPSMADARRTRYRRRPLAGPGGLGRACGPLGRLQRAAARGHGRGLRGAGALPAEVKAEVRAHASHVLLYYTGHDADPLEQYVAVAAVAGALAEAGGVAVMNEHAHTSLPAGVFTRASLGDESLELLRSLPLTMLYCGFVKYEVEGTEGVWMRTYGADRFGLPDFAALAEGHHQGEFYSNIFNNIMAYLLQSGAEMDAGHTMQIGENAYLKLREPDEPEYFLQGPGRTLVAEIIAEDQINRPDA